jgi:hypothetical protein
MKNKQLPIYCITEVAPDGIEHPAQADPQPLGVPARLHGRLRRKDTSMYPPPPPFSSSFCSSRLTEPAWVQYRTDS